MIATSLLLLAATPAASGDGDGEAKKCGSGEPAFNGWNYSDLRAHRVKCAKAHKAAEVYVYDFSTEGVIDPPRHWDRCKDKRVAPRLWKGNCKRTKGNLRQRITFLFTGPPG